jgi:hypothetical protein
MRNGPGESTGPSRQASIPGWLRISLDDAGRLSAGRGGRGDAEDVIGG